MPPRHAAPVLLAALALAASPAAAEGYAIELFPPASAAAVFVLWVLVFFLVLVYCDEIRRATLAHVWTLSTLGQVLFLVGLTVIQSSYLSVPSEAYAQWVAADPYPSAARLVLIFAVVISGLLFLVEWAHVFGLEPRALSARGLAYLPLAAALAALAFAFPFRVRPELGITPQSMVFPVVAVAAFLTLNAYVTLVGYHLLRRVRVLSRFKWMLGYSVLLALLMAVMVSEYAATPAALREQVYPPILFPLFMGALLLLVGYVVLLHAAQLFVRALLPPPPRPLAEVEGGLGLEVAADLASRYVSEAPLVRIVERVRRESPALAPLAYDRDGRRLLTEGLDPSSPEVLSALPALYLALFDGLVRGRPPAVDKDYSEEPLKRELSERLGDRVTRLPPGIAGHLLPRTRVLRSALSEAVDAALAALPLDAGFGAAVAERTREALGGDFLARREGGGMSFDAERFLADVKAEGEDELFDEAVQRYLRAHRAMFEPVCRLLDRRRLRSLLEDHVRPVAERPLYRAAGVSEVLLNASFARDHGWGVEEVESAVGRLPAGHLVLVASDPGFPKERLFAAVLAENLEHYRNGVWVSQSKPSVLKEALGAYVGADQLVEGGFLRLVRIEPTVEGVRESKDGSITAGDSGDDIEWAAKRALGSFPPSTSVAAVELPVSLLQREPLELYRFVTALKALSDAYSATVLLGVNNELCGDRSFAVLSDLAEVVVEAKRDGRLKLRRVGAAKEAFASVSL